MQKTFILLGIIIFSLISTAQAKKVPGYIVTEDSDTLYGEIKLPKFNLLTGGWIISGFNQEPFYYEIWFKSNESNKFNRFQADQISGYGFRFESLDYIFKSFIIESNTPIKKEKKRYRFLKLYHYGETCLYIDMLRITTYENLETEEYSFSHNNSSIYYDYNYYLYNNLIGLSKVEKSKEIESIEELLYLYDFKKDFIESLPNKTEFKDIKAIMVAYEIWNRDNTSYKVTKI